MKNIQLQFDKSRVTVSGNDYGQQVFKEQVSPFYNGNELITVFFPDNIEVVGMSFAQGFIHDIAEELGAKNVEKVLIVKSKYKRVVDKFKEAVDFYD